MKRLLGSIEEKVVQCLEYYPSPDSDSAKEFGKLVATSKSLTSADKKLILTLSKILNLSEMKAHEVLREYRREKVVCSHESHNDGSSADPLGLAVEIRSFYFRQRFSILNIARLLLAHEGDENFIYCHEIQELAQKISPKLLDSLVYLLDWNSSDWRDFEIEKEECYLDFSPRCTSLVKENHIIWSEQVVSEFEILLEIAILLGKRHVKYLHVDGTHTPASSFNSFDMQRVLYKAMDCGFSLPIFPSQRLLAVSSVSTTNLEKILNGTVMRVQYLWVAFIISLCKFPYTTDCCRRHQAVKHPLINLSGPCQLPPKELLTYIDSLRGLNSVKDIEMYGHINRMEPNPAALITFALSYFLEIVTKNVNSNIDPDYTRLSPIVQEVVKKLADSALDSLVLLSHCINGTYGTFYAFNDYCATSLPSSVTALSTRMRNHILEVLRPFVISIARVENKDIGCFNESDPNQPLTSRVDLYSDLFQQVLQCTWNKFNDPDLMFLRSMLETMHINTYRPVSLFKVLAGTIRHDWDFVIQILNRRVNLSTVEPMISFPYSENDGQFIPRPNTSNHFIASKLRGCRAEVRGSQAEQVLVLWDYKITNWVLLLGTIVGSAGRDLETWSEKGQCLVASLQIICRILEVDGGDKEVRLQCLEYINLSGASIAEKNPFSLITDPIITLVEHFLPILSAERSSEQHLIFFVTLLEFLMEMMKIVDNTVDIVLGITSRFSYSETSLPERLYMIAMRNRNSLRGSFAVVSIIKFMSALVNETRMSPDRGKVNIKSIFDEIDEDGNGRISREELREGLQKLGYSVSQVISDSLHAQLDIRGTGSIYFSDLVTFATKDEEEQQPRTEVESAMRELQAQLSDCFIPGGRAAFITSKRFGECSVDFAFSMLDAVNYWTFEDQNAKKKITLHLMNLFKLILQNLPLYDFGYSFALHASAQIMRRIRDDSKNGLLLLQTALSVGLSAVHGGLKKEYNVTDDCKPMVLGMSTSGAPKSKLNNLLGSKYSMEKILPINFTQVLINDLDHQLTVCSLSVLDHLMEYIIHHMEEFMPNFLGLFISHADLPIGLTQTNSGNIPCSRGPSHSTPLPCTYMAILAGYIRKSSVGPREVAEVDTLSAKLLVKLLSCRTGSFRNNSNSGFVDVASSPLSTVGEENINHLAITLCDLLNQRDGKKFEECEALRSSAMDIFLSLATFHQDALAHLIEQIPNMDVISPCKEACVELKLSTEAKKKIYESGEFTDDLVDVIMKKIQNQKTTPSMAPTSSSNDIMRNRVCNVLARERLRMKFLLPDSKSDNSDDILRNGELSVLRPENSFFVSQIFVELLNKHDDRSLYHSQPLIFFKVTKLVMILFEKLPNTSINGAVAHILQSRLFWSSITEPLFDDLVQVDVESREEEAIIEHCQKVMCHSAVLELVTSERFGNSVHLFPPAKHWKKGVVTDVNKSGVSIVLEEDPSQIIQFIRPHLLRHKVESQERKGELTADVNGKSASVYPVKRGDIIEYCTLCADRTLDKIVTSFFEQAANCHRFTVWLHGASKGVDGAGFSYMDVEYDQEAIDNMKIKTERLGLQLRDLLTVSSSLSDQFTVSEVEKWLRISKYGPKYVFDSDAIFPIADKMLWSDEEHELVQTIILNNLMLSKADAELNLFKNWKKFLEIFILPSPMLSQKNIIAESPRSPSRRNSEGGEGRFSPHLHGPSRDGVPPSPSSTGISSSFEGDKRSYDALKCLARQFRRLSSQRTLFAADLEIIHEKAELFMNMLHHQLKEVVSRTKDPSHADTASRSSASHRLDGNKISEFLAALDCAFSFYNTGASLIPPLVALSQGPKAATVRDSMASRKSAANQAILSSVLLLVSDSQYHLWNPEDASKKQMVTDMWMTHAVNCLEAEMKREDFYILLEKSLKIGDGKRGREINPLTSEEEKTLKSILTQFQILLQLITQLIISGATGGSCANQLCTLVRNLFKRLSSHTSNYVHHYANYNHWPKINPVRVGDAFLEAPTLSTLTGIETDLPVDVVELALRCMSDAMDLVTNCCDIQDGVIIRTFLSVGMIQELTGSKLLLAFQDMLFEQDGDRSRVLMSYSSRNGEMSDVCEVWKRCLLMADRLLEMMSETSLDDTMALDLLLKFLAKYEYILYLPLIRTSEHRLSLGSLTLCTLSTRLFFKIASTMGESTNITVSGLLRRFSDDALNIVKDTIPLLGVGDVNEQGGFLASKLNLHGHLLAISKSEIYEEHSVRKKGTLRKRMGMLKNLSKTIGKIKSPKKDGAIALEVGLLSSRRRIKEDEMSYEDGGHYPMMHLLLDAETLLLESLVPVLSFVRTLMPRFMFSIIQNIPNPTDFYTEGSSVVYHSKTHRDIFQGQIVSRNMQNFTGKLEYSVVSKNGTREYGIGAESILYPREPLIEFYAMDIKFHGAMEHGRMVQSLYGCSVSHLFFLLEYLMRSELDTKLADAFPDWGGVESVDKNLRYLSEQVIAILTQTLAHHSIKVNYDFIDSESLRKKIADLRDILEKVSKAGIRYARGSTSVLESPLTRGSFDSTQIDSHDANEDDDFSEFISNAQSYLSRIHDAVQKRMCPQPDAGDINDFDEEGSIACTIRSRSHSRTMSHGTDENQTPHPHTPSISFFTKSPSVATGRPRTPGSSIRNKVEYLD